MTAPDRIWVDFEPRDWPTERIMYGDMDKPYVEYFRLDPAVLAALPEVKALVLAERERCANVAEDAAPVTQDMNHTQIADACYRIATAMRKGADHE